MRPDDILEYAKLAVGFPVKVGDRVRVIDEYEGTDYDDVACQSAEDAVAEVMNIRMENFPGQLTIELDVLLDEATNRRMPITVDETDVWFPIEKYLTPEEEQAERDKILAEEAKKTPANESDQERRDRIAREDEEWERDYGPYGTFS